jgi:hypothetical protein
MRVCLTCTHSQRLTIEKMMLQGHSLASIRRQFPDLSEDSLSNHRMNHLSKRLVTMTKNREAAEGLDLRREIEDLIGRVKGVLDFTENHKQHVVFLKAAGELRGNFELLLKIAVALNEAEQSSIKAKAEAEAAKREQQFADSLSVLTTNELRILEAISNKLTEHDRRNIIISDSFNIDQLTEPRRTMRRLSFPDHTDTPPE